MHTQESIEADLFFLRVLYSNVCVVFVLLAFVYNCLCRSSVGRTFTLSSSSKSTSCVSSFIFLCISGSKLFVTIWNVNLYVVELSLSHPHTCMCSVKCRRSCIKRSVTKSSRMQDRGSPLLASRITLLTTLNGGSLGSWVDEERS